MLILMGKSPAPLPPQDTGKSSLGLSAPPGLEEVLTRLGLEGDIFTEIIVSKARVR